MTIKVYNSLTRKKEEFIPINKNELKMYACGVTIYDLCHIGHAMQAMVYDVIRNYFIFKGYKVTYIRNFTDIDDKIINRAKALNIGALELSENMIKENEKDFLSLDIKKANIEPKVSDHIKDIIELIEKIIENGYAYSTENGNVYFNVRKFKNYGKLSNRNIDELEDGVRIENNNEKKDPIDFALWKAMKNDENIGFNSPWGKGRPGWHIECSAMSIKYLGKTFDIHGGGLDLIFPHHENEIAQSEAATGQKFANYFIHNGLITVNKQKMSKSVGNFLTIKDAVKKYHKESIRFVILSNHYSSNLDLSPQQFEDSYKRLDYFYSTLYEIEKIEPNLNNSIKILDEFDISKIKTNFIEAMDDNFNSAKAIANFSETFNYLNELLSRKGMKQKNKIPTLVAIKNEILKCSKILGLFCYSPKQVLEELKEYGIKNMNISFEEIKENIDIRNNARKNKDFETSDSIRDKLLTKNIIINDTPNGTEWKIKW